MTVIPLDQSFQAFDVTWSDEVNTAGEFKWTVGLEAGMRFTVMLK
jgi:hypothetical protein